MLYAARVVGEALEDEYRREALWSYRANTPMVGEGKSRRPMPFDEFWQRMTGVQVDEKLPEISDEEIEALMKHGRIGLVPPGMAIKGE